MTSKKSFSTEQNSSPEHPVTEAVDGAVLPVEAAWRASGLDLLHPFDLSAWNLAAPPSERLPDFDRANPLALILANTRALWPIFIEALRHDPELRAHADPLDRYIEAATLAPLTPHRTTALFAHTLLPAPIPIQRLAHHAGLATLAPCHLNIHPTHGPWIALRALVVFDLDGPTHHPPPADTCASCPKPCLPPLQRALDAARAARHDPLIPHWHRWLAVRDACPIGLTSRYAEDQIRYHYAKDRRILDTPET